MGGLGGARSELVVTRLRNFVIATHRGALATAGLVTGVATPLQVVPYVVSLPIVAAITLICFTLDPEGFDEGGEFDASQR